MPDSKAEEIVLCLHGGLSEIEPEWKAAVRANLEATLKHAALIDQFPLPDEAEPAPVFRA